MPDYHASRDRAALREMLAAGTRLAFPVVDNPLVSVLIAVHNRADWTLRCLRALASTRVPLEVIVVDNASSDETAELLSRVENIAVIRNAENLGFLDAVNAAASRATGDLLLLLNNDTDLLPGALEAAVETIQAHRTIGAVVGKLIHVDGRLQEAGSIIWRDGSCQGYGRGDDPGESQYMFQRDVDFGSGAFLLTRRLLFLENGGFAEIYKPAYYEDADYCARLWQAGLRVTYEPRAVVIHGEFASSASERRALDMQAERRTVFLRRHREWLETTACAPGTDLVRARVRGSRGQRVLLIEDRVPHERLGSGYPRSLAITRALVELGHQVSVYPLLTPTEPWHVAYSDVPREVELVMGRGQAGLARFLGERYHHLDTVIISRPHNFRIACDAFPTPTTGRPAIVYDAEALFALRDIGRLRLSATAVTEGHAKQLVADELSSVRHCDLVTTVSAAERDHFVRAGFAEVTVLGNSLVPNPTAPPFEDRRDFLFVGAFVDDTAPNTDSIVWFVRNVLPLIRARLGAGVRLGVVGRDESRVMSRLADSSLYMRGMIDDLSPVFASARVFVAPTRFGAGLPTKVQQAAAAGIPVVGSALVATQLDWRDEEELLVAENAEAFAEQCCRLYQDRGLWNRLRESALARVATDCSAEAFRTTVAEVLTQAHTARTQGETTIGVGLHTELTSR